MSAMKSTVHQMGIVAEIETIAAEMVVVQVGLNVATVVVVVEKEINAAAGIAAKKQTSAAETVAVHMVRNAALVFVVDRDINAAMAVAGQSIFAVANSFAPLMNLVIDRYARLQSRNGFIENGYRWVADTVFHVSR